MKASSRQIPKVQVKTSTDPISKGHFGDLIRNRLDPFLFWWSTPKALPSEADIPDELLLAMSGTLQGGFLSQALPQTHPRRDPGRLRAEG
jgi:hypothetical protein